MAKRLMRSIAVLAMVFTSACSDRSPVGIYRAEAKPSPGADPKLVAEASATIELRADGTLTSYTGNDARRAPSGSWVLEGGRLVVRMKQKDGRETAQSLKYTGDTVTVGDASKGEYAIVLRRQ